MRQLRIQIARLFAIVRKLLRVRFAPTLEPLRLHLSRADALGSSTLFGVFIGLLAGGVVVCFRLLVELLQATFLPGGGEHYEALPLLARALLPVGGAALIAVGFARFAWSDYMLGVAQVMGRMEYHQGNMRARGFVLQFFGAVTAIASGHSVGREGPSVYLGAAAGSLFGQWLRLPSNSIRTLLVCGTAAGISASFNTPLAGVIFAVEVLALEYSMAMIVPMMLAAVSANAVSIAVFGGAPLFEVRPFIMTSLYDLLPVIVLGLVAGAVSAAYTQSIQTLARRSKPLGFPRRVLLAGVLAGVCGVLVPEVMGLGTDTQARLLNEALPWTFLLVLLLAKLVASVGSLGLGIPAGNIGPTLFIGAVLGNLTAVAASAFTEIDAMHASFYALLGMGAMMSSNLKAPLAGLTAIVELSHSPGVIMPGMLAIILAVLVCSRVFRKEGIFTTMLRASGRDYRSSPVLQVLRAEGVASVMESRFIRCPPTLSRTQAATLLAKDTRWILVDHDSVPAYMMSALAIPRFLAHEAKQVASGELAAPGDDAEIRLVDIPGDRYELAAVNSRASLQEALERLDATHADALYVDWPLAPGIHRIYGVVTRASIEQLYRY